MSHPTIIQTPGTLQFLQQGFQQGLDLARQQQAINLQRQQVTADIAAKQAQLGIEERQAEANEAFRRGYQNYLDSRAQYYGAKTQEIQRYQDQLNGYLNTLDPAKRQAAGALLALGELHPGSANAVSRILFPNVADPAVAARAANLWKTGITWGQAYQMAGGDPAQVPGGTALAALRAPKPPGAATLNQRLMQLNRNRTFDQARIEKADKAAAAWVQNQMDAAANGNDDQMDPIAQSLKKTGNFNEASLRAHWLQRFAPEYNDWKQNIDKINAEVAGTAGDQSFLNTPPSADTGAAPAAPLFSAAPAAGSDQQDLSQDQQDDMIAAQLNAVGP